MYELHVNVNPKFQETRSGRITSLPKVIVKLMFLFYSIKCQLSLCIIKYVRQGWHHLPLTNAHTYSKRAHHCYRTKPCHTRYRHNAAPTFHF